jgi:aminopeptidase N
MIKNPLSFASVLLCLFLPQLISANDGYPRNPKVDIIHYCFKISLNDSTNRIEGSAGITLFLTGKVGTLELDLVGLNSQGVGMVVDGIKSGPDRLTYRHEDNRISIDLPDTMKTPGTFSLSVNYSGIPIDGLIISRNKFGDRTFFGDNWPDRARNWLPCVDHPSDKATVEFIVSAPEHYKVVGIGALMAGYPEISSKNSRKWVTYWKEDVPVPTKVMVIGAADFAWETAGYSKGIAVQTWVYAQNREAGFIDYKPAVDIVDFYQDLIGPYSFEKLANVQSKTMFGGMENSGCIFYYEGSVSGKNNLSTLLAHEIAHQWFGDAVTENDWHHIWLSEGFATYLEAVYSDSLIPDRKLDANMSEMRKSVIQYFERTHKPLIDTTITNMMNLLNTNSYQKGAWVLHMLRQELGDRMFWTGMRDFYSNFRDRNAMTSDFQTIMEHAAGRSLAGFFYQWLEIPGQPNINWSWVYNKKKNRVEIDIEQTQSQYDFTFKLPIELRGSRSVSDPALPVRSAYFEVPVNGKRAHIDLPTDFPVSEIRLDPKSKLLFQEKMIHH